MVFWVWETQWLFSLFLKYKAEYFNKLHTHVKEDTTFQNILRQSAGLTCLWFNRIIFALIVFKSKKNTMVKQINETTDDVSGWSRTDSYTCDLLVYIFTLWPLESFTTSFSSVLLIFHCHLHHDFSLLLTCGYPVLSSCSLPLSFNLLHPFVCLTSSSAIKVQSK